MDTNTVLIAFGLTLFAGLSTGIGSALAFFSKRNNVKFLSVALGFSAGVMIYVSFAEMLPEANRFLIESFGERQGKWLAAGAFFAGIFIIALIDKIVPSYENPHEIHRVSEMDDPKLQKNCGKLLRMGFLSAVAIAIHNFPEGIVTFTSALQDLKLGAVIAFAIAIHNIPEGISISVPIYYATCDRKKAFKWSFLSGMAEPLGALIGYFFLMRFFSDAVLGGMFAMIAGIMVFISLDQLLPAAREYGEHHLSIYGLLAGMVVMALSLLIFI
jgi:zinc transporter, ZIP family